MSWDNVIFCTDCEKSPACGARIFLPAVEIAQPAWSLKLASLQLEAYPHSVRQVCAGLSLPALTDILPDSIRKLSITETHIIGNMMVFDKPALRYHRTAQRGGAPVNRVDYA